MRLTAGSLLVAANERDVEPSTASGGVDLRCDTGADVVTCSAAVPRQVAEPTLRSAAAHLVASLQERHPTAPGALVQRCVDEAVHRFRDAPVRLYLPVLIERLARASLRDALGSPDRVGELHCPAPPEPTRGTQNSAR